MKNETKRAPAVYMTLETQRKLRNYIALCPQEISGMGTVTRVYSDKDKRDWLGFLVDDVYLCRQEVTGVSTVFDPAAYDELVTRLNATGVNHTESDGASKLKLLWHSHADMGVFWSGTDETAIDQFNHAKWLISIVGNHKNELLARVDFFEPARVTVNDLEVKEWITANDPLYAAQEAEVKSLVTQSKVSSESWGDRWSEHGNAAFTPDLWEAEKKEFKTRLLKLKRREKREKPREVTGKFCRLCLEQFGTDAFCAHQPSKP